MKKYWQAPKYVNDGDELRIIVKWVYNEDGSRTGRAVMRVCKVVAACGNHASVAYNKDNEPVVELVSLERLRVHPDDIRHPDNHEQVIREAMRVIRDV